MGEASRISGKGVPLGPAPKLAGRAVPRGEERVDDTAAF